MLLVRPSPNVMKPHAATESSALPVWLAFCCYLHTAGKPANRSVADYFTKCVACFWLLLALCEVCEEDPLEGAFFEQMVERCSTCTESTTE